jgi:hypothetical protein
MANHKGSEGLVKVGTNTVAELRGWELTSTGEAIEDTILSDTAKTFKPGNTGWSGSLSCWYDETDTNGQETMDAGSEVSLYFYVEGTATNATSFSGSAIITSLKRGAAINSIVDAQFSFTGNGVLTQTN